MGSVARITNISARSDTGFDDAVATGIERANQTLRNVQGAWVKDTEVSVNGNQVTEWRVRLRITFVVK